MVKWLLTVLFLVVTTGNSLAAVSPHLEGDAGCAMSCCHEAHQAGPQSLASKICCTLECEQPAGIPAFATITATTSTQDRAPSHVLFVRMPQVAHYLQQAR